MQDKRVHPDASPQSDQYIPIPIPQPPDNLTMDRRVPAVASTQATIVEQKQTFLKTRKHILSRGIPPSERLRTLAQDGGIELSVMKGVLDKVNRDLKQHSRKVYSRQMIEHVVEQIDTLYWESGAQHVDDEDLHAASDTHGDDANALYQGDDLTHDENIARLPATWHARDANSNITQDEYLSSVSRLQELSAHRQTLQNRLDTYRTLLSLLEPYRQPKENIQPNLVWRDAPLAPELTKMRTLAVRVAARVEERLGHVQVPGTAEDGEDVDMEDLSNHGRRKVDAVLASW
ncbi:kinetochore fta4 [Pyrenophora seminiperda CCB06]|uniref:Kinetochore fta4 n=1 Tax=Pyrenophora seminiperda CCB06 TaxID=1302712 RepID=A0A3M7M899_9PLEO|nr:kinetochore fta4 [Pyrenophora seminiperda CCB06]